MQANPTTTDWPLKVYLNGAGFSGPQNLLVKALTTGYYPLTFYPHREGQTEVSSRGCVWTFYYSCIFIGLSTADQ